MMNIDEYEAIEHALPSLLAYCYIGIEPGSFLTSVLENNLVEASGRADIQNSLILPSYAKFLHNVAPLDAWGSKEVVSDWVRARLNVPLSIAPSILKLDRYDSLMRGFERMCRSYGLTKERE